MELDVIFIAGPQGSGKGTQGEKLAEKLGFLFWGMGHTLRELLKEDSPLAHKISSMDEGTLLSDELIKEILEERIALIPRDRGVIFDGVPRTKGQAEFLIPYLRGHGREHMATIFMDVPREESMRRLLLRAEHESRTDDTPEAIETRFRFYDEMMAPTVEYLKKETSFFDVDGTPSVDDISKNIDALLKIDTKHG